MNYDGEAGRMTAEVRMRGFGSSRRLFLVNFSSENNKK